jgi:hypothetical protein
VTNAPRQCRVRECRTIIPGDQDGYCDAHQRIVDARSAVQALQARGAWAHGLAYDRGGARLGAGVRRGGASDALPINVTERQRGDATIEVITAAADAGIEHLYLKAAKQLAYADRNLATATRRVQHLRHRTLPTQIITTMQLAPTIIEFAALCRHVADGLERAGAALPRLDPAALPDHRTPPRPIECRNPRNYDRCDGLPLYDKTRRLCEPCYQREQYLERRAAT